MIVAVFATMNIMWIAIAQYAGYFTGMDSSVKEILTIAEWILATPTLFYSGWVFYRGAWYGLKNRLITMDLLVATGSTLTYGYSIWAALTHNGEPYFDSVTMIITFVLVGKFLEVLSKKSAVDTMDALTSSMPTDVTVLRDGVESSVAVESVEVGENVVIKAGDRIALDGVIIKGEGSVDESSLTGESLPVAKKEGDDVFGGTIGIDGSLIVRTTKDFAHSTLSVIANMLEESLTKRPHIEQLANTLSGYFSQTILAISLLAFVVWLNVGSTFEHAFIIAISVIVIACPCALALATPVATLVGIASASKRGVVFKAASHIETLAKADIVVFDKTGTLTMGKPKVITKKMTPDFSPSVVAALLTHSKHPIALGVLQELQVANTPEASSVQTIAGRGIQGVVNGQKVIAGNDAMMEENGVVYDTSESEYSTFYVAVDGVMVGCFQLADTIKKGAREAVQTCKDLGLEVMMLTGDNGTVAQKIANDLGIDRFYANISPLQKGAYIEELHLEGKIVVMVGDGINDALALSKSDIAVAMGNGSGIALDVSDVVLLRHTMEDFAFALTIAHKTYKTIKQNIALSFAYNALTIPLAVMGYVIPLVAALSMSLSSLIVVGNSMRIKNDL
jgi:Cu+-exporting ATPase